jgi:hypothetical protein
MCVADLAKTGEAQLIPVPEPRSASCYETDNVQRCFGAVGDKCKSQQDGTLGNRRFDYECRINLAVSVGSIMHDNCCLSNPYGIWCNGWPQALTLEIANIGEGVACGREWRKAVYDWLQDRFWYETFGPYRGYDGDSGLNDYVQARTGYTYGFFGVHDSPQKWPGPERRATVRLRAPSGTKLEFQDAAFCASGEFSSTHEVGSEHYGYCR